MAQALSGALYAPRMMQAGSVKSPQAARAPQMATKTAPTAGYTADQISQQIMKAMAHRQQYLANPSAAGGGYMPNGAANWQIQQAAQQGLLGNGGYMRFSSSGGISNLPSQTQLLTGLSASPAINGMRGFQTGGGIGNAGTDAIATQLGYTPRGGGVGQSFGTTPTITNMRVGGAATPGWGGGGVYGRLGGGGAIPGSSGTPGYNPGAAGGGVGGTTGTGANGDLASLIQQYHDQANADNQGRYDEGKGNITSGQAAQNQTFQQGYQGLYDLAGQISDSQLQRVKQGNQQDLAAARSRFYGMGLSNTSGAVMAESGVRDQGILRENEVADQALKTRLGLQSNYVNQQNQDARANRNELNQWIYNKQVNGPDMAFWANLLSRPGANGAVGAGGGFGYGGVSGYGGVDPYTGQQVSNVTAGGSSNTIRRPGGGGNVGGFGSTGMFGDTMGFLRRSQQEPTGPNPYSGSYGGYGGAQGGGYTVTNPYDLSGMYGGSFSGSYSPNVSTGGYENNAGTGTASPEMMNAPVGAIMNLNGMMVQKQADGGWIYVGG